MKVAEGKCNQMKVEKNKKSLAKKYTFLVGAFPRCSTRFFPAKSGKKLGLQSVKIAQFREDSFSALSAPLRERREKGEFGCGLPRWAF